MVHMVCKANRNSLISQSVPPQAARLARSAIPGRRRTVRGYPARGAAYRDSELYDMGSPLSCKQPFLPTTTVGAPYAPSSLSINFFTFGLTTHAPCTAGV